MRRLNRVNACSQLADTAQALAAWPTPQTHDDKLRGNTRADNHYFPHDLSNAATLASWSTPKAEDSECAGAHRGTADTLHSQANLAGWPTPNTEDCKRDDWTKKALNEAVDAGVAPPSTSQRLRSFATLASWPTPMAGSPATENYNEAGNNDSSRKTVELAAWPSPCTPNGGRSMSPEKMDVTGMTLDGRKHTTTLEHAVKFAGPVRLTASGEMLTGLDAGMASSGQLNPEHSLWLQAIPDVWVCFALRAMQSTSKRRKHSLKRTSKQNT